MAPNIIQVKKYKVQRSKLWYLKTQELKNLKTKIIMEFNRFMQYAKYDLTINKAFYRNMSIVAVSIITGIAILGFLVRWTMIKNFGVGVDHDAHQVVEDGVGRVGDDTA